MSIKIKGNSLQFVREIFVRIHELGIRIILKRMLFLSYFFLLRKVSS